jgi:eukaryotic-like serine/threonine-protein kinase
MTAVDVVPVLPSGHRLPSGYVVRDHLSRGDALDVYEVWSEERHCSCVAKTLRPDRVTAARVERLVQEGRLVEMLRHPNLVCGYETIATEPPILILETLTGATLSHVIESRRRRLAWVDVAVLGIQLCAVVQYLHRHGFLHLDLKPDNVVAQCGTAKVIDLGLARPPGRGPAGLGTIEYLAPEQARGLDFTEATDVWGIGATLYEAVSGSAPFCRTLHPGTDKYPQLVRRAPPLRSQRPVPVPLATAIDEALNPCGVERPTIAHLETVFRAMLEARCR